MASSSKNCNESTNGGSSNNGKATDVHGQRDGPSFQHQKTISVDWTPEEQAIFEETLIIYASEPTVIRYSKIATLLKTKTVRDIAMRCQWMTKKEACKRRKMNVDKRIAKDRNVHIEDLNQP
ncbi:uncharacterized protein LOC127241838 [Andrographis paniculata]|uniref:uncharacterized protein LOC127241838 n=1 Tax=Andrographis paniculata TaxID=175694 RepID=UPI0021E99C0A|nr:uncharacterized protein LOC127241838 [Andrographis paniculata]